MLQPVRLVKKRALEDVYLPVHSAIIIPIVRSILKTEVNFPVTLNQDIGPASTVRLPSHGSSPSALPVVKAIMHPNIIGSAVNQQSLVTNAYILASANRHRLYRNAGIRHVLHLLYLVSHTD